jgi:hypothetical protein
MRFECSSTCSQEAATRDTVLIQNSVLIFAPFFFKIYFNIVLSSTPWSPDRALLFRLFFIYSMLATFPAHLILLDVIALIIFGVEHKIV